MGCWLIQSWYSPCGPPPPVPSAAMHSLAMNTVPQDSLFASDPSSNLNLFFWWCFTTKISTDMEMFSYYIITALCWIFAVVHAPNWQKTKCSLIPQYIHTACMYLSSCNGLPDSADMTAAQIPVWLCHCLSCISHNLTAVAISTWDSSWKNVQKFQLV